jgi:uncharacterized protein (DUF433 family)
MDAVSNSLVGLGVYSVAEAAQLTGASPAAVRRWMFGYHYRYKDAERSQPAVWKADIDPVGGQITLSFLDLMEVRFIRAFRQHGVSWKTIREAARVACDIVHDVHPFARRKFRTDGIRIFQEVRERGKAKLLDLNRKSWVFHEIIGPSLFEGIEYEGDTMARWFPVSGSRAIVVDPAILFGRPVLTREGVPTDVLAAAVKANDNDVDAVVRWYSIPRRAVQAAVEFETRLAA